MFFLEKDLVNPEKLCYGLNAILEKNLTDIRIRKIVEVPLDFFIRQAAFSRTYCYRIAVPRHNFFDGCPNLNYLTSSIPITELNRVQVIPQPFHPHLILDACKVFLGKWNFRTFAAPAADRLKKAEEEEDYVKTVRRISLTRVNSFIEHSYHIDPRLKEIDFYDFHVEGSGFLRRQVRKDPASFIFQFLESLV